MSNQGKVLSLSVKVNGPGTTVEMVRRLNRLVWEIKEEYKALVKVSTFDDNPKHPSLSAKFDIPNLSEKEGGKIERQLRECAHGAKNVDVHYEVHE